jgi:hypothetical protein
MERPFAPNSSVVNKLFSIVQGFRSSPSCLRYNLRCNKIFIAYTVKIHVAEYFDHQTVVGRLFVDVGKLKLAGGLRGQVSIMGVLYFDQLTNHIMGELLLIVVDSGVGRSRVNA